MLMQKNTLIRKLRLISKFMTSRIREQIIKIYILGYQIMKFGQLIEFNIRNIAKMQKLRQED